MSNPTVGPSYGLMPGAAGVQQLSSTPMKTVGPPPAIQPNATQAAYGTAPPPYGPPANGAPPPPYGAPNTTAFPSNTAPPGYNAATVPNSNPPSPAAQVLQAQQGLSNETSYAEKLQIETEIRTLALTTANSLRQSKMAAVHSVAMQAESFASQFEGDEISQAKKKDDNAGKAV